MDEWIGILIAGILVVCFIAVFIYCIYIAIQTRKNLENQPKMEELQGFAPEVDAVSSLEEIYATVVDQRCEVKMVGLQTPKTMQSFVVVFQTRNREYISFEVPEEMYHGLEIGQSGMLTYVEDNLYGFALEESE